MNYFKVMINFHPTVYKIKGHCLHLILLTVTNLTTVVPLYNGHLGAKITGRCREVSIRVKSLHRCTVGTKCTGRCREVAVMERWPLAKVRLYIIISDQKQLKHDCAVPENIHTHGHTL